MEMKVSCIDYLAFMGAVLLPLMEGFIAGYIVVFSLWILADLKAFIEKFDSKLLAFTSRTTRIYSLYKYTSDI